MEFTLFDTARSSPANVPFLEYELGDTFHDRDSLWLVPVLPRGAERSTHIESL